MNPLNDDSFPDAQTQLVELKVALWEAISLLSATDIYDPVWRAHTQVFLEQFQFSLNPEEDE